MLSLESRFDRAKIVDVARTFLDTPFHHQARVKGVGVDCAGLVGMVAGECGIALNDHENLNYSRYPTAGRHLLRLCQEQLIERQIHEMVPGNVLLFWVHRPTLPQHLAIVSGPGTIIHAWYEAGKVIETPLGPYWSSRIFKVFDLPGVV